MELTTLIGYVAMTSLGVVLGLIGAGGSILTVPILVYLLDIAPIQATGYSLAIVGTTALVGSLQCLRRGDSSPRMAAVFGIPSIVGVYVSRRIVVPAIPDPVLQVSTFTLSKDAAIMVLFAALMLVMSVSMIRTAKGAETEHAQPVRSHYTIIVALGVAVGVFTGIVGAGGGFMILPVLVLLGGLRMKVAVGTSLLIIAAKSLIGFTGEMQVAETIDYAFLGSVIVMPLIGIALGSYLNQRVPAAGLRGAFGWFVLVMAVYIVTREIMGA